MATAAPTGLSPFEIFSETVMQDARERSGEGVGTSFLEWSLRVPEPKAGRLDFDRYPFQKELYSSLGANHREIVVLKSTQVGISTWLLRWVMYHADLRGLNSLYVFPKLKQMYDFADARIRPAILGSDYLKGRITPGSIANKGLKEIGTGFLYCRGSESSDQLQAVDADFLALDEYEDLRRENIPDAENRLGNSDYAYIRRVGIPNTPGRGLDKLYHESDMRQWHVRCESCGERQPLAYDANVDEANVQLVCRKCGKGPLNTLEGEWVAEYPERETVGYHVQRLIAPLGKRRLTDLIERHKLTNPNDRKKHYNQDLGLAWAEEEGRLSDEALERAQRGEIPLDATGQLSGELRTMGVDVASTRDLNVVVRAHDGSGTKRNLYIGTAKNFSELVRIFKTFDVNFACIDHLPEGRLARTFAEKFPGRVWLVAMSGTQKELMKPKMEIREVTVNRTLVLDAMLDSIRTQHTLLPDPVPEAYKEHLQNLNRVVERDEWGRQKVDYQEHGPTDYAQAEAYDRVAEHLFFWLRDVERGVTGETYQLDDEYDFERAALDAGTVEPRLDLPTYRPGFEHDEP